jgi:NAD(P)-dependent dehydrogenase (short-subunit alcohol dehydrogenase family)
VFELGAVIKSFQVRGHGGIGIPAMSHYIPTKMGIIGFMRGLANDVANDGVTANAMDNSPRAFRSAWRKEFTTARAPKTLTSNSRRIASSGSTSRGFAD